MLRIYQDALLLVRLMRPLWEKVGKHNRGLRKQLEECAPSVPLNLAEGHMRSDGHQRERFGQAIASARECIAGLETSVAAGYLDETECTRAIDVADKIIATIWKCVHGKRRRA
jgi:four helix bundle protein